MQGTEMLFRTLEVNCQRRPIGRSSGLTNPYRILNLPIKCDYPAYRVGLFDVWDTFLEAKPGGIFVSREATRENHNLSFAQSS